MLQIYKNLHRKQLSVRRNGVVAYYVDSICLKNAKFVVQPAGREKVRITKRKNVHAYIAGTECLYDDLKLYREVYYNPYKVDTFVYKDTGEPIYNAEYCLITYEGVYVK